MKPTGRQAVVYNLIRSAPNGLTADQVDEATGWGHQSSSSAVTALKTKGYVVPLVDKAGPVQRVTRTGCLGTVVVAVKGAPRPPSRKQPAREALTRGFTDVLTQAGVLPDRPAPDDADLVALLVGVAANLGLCEAVAS